MFKNLLSKLIVLIPGCCLLCNQRTHTGYDLCASCWAQLPWLHRGCQQCAQPLDTEEESIARFCGTCLSKPPAYDSTISLFIYQDAIISLITKLKFHRNLSVGRLFGGLIAKRLIEENVFPLPDLLIPVPLHPKRLRQRGFNQAIIIAEHLSYRLKIPMDRTHCHRQRNTAPQSQTPAKERSKNLARAFHINFAKPPSHIAIIDDVMTTGATVNALSKALKKAGVNKITVWCCARTHKAYYTPRSQPKRD